MNAWSHTGTSRLLEVRKCRATYQSVCSLHNQLQQATTRLNSTPSTPDSPAATSAADPWVDCILSPTTAAMQHTEDSDGDRALPFASCYEQPAPNRPAPPAPTTAPAPSAAGVCIMRKAPDQPGPQLDCSVLHQAGLKTRDSHSCIPVSVILTTWHQLLASSSCSCSRHSSAQHGTIKHTARTPQQTLISQQMQSAVRCLPITTHRQSTF